MLHLNEINVSEQAPQGFSESRWRGRAFEFEPKRTPNASTLKLKP